MTLATSIARAALVSLAVLGASCSGGEDVVARDQIEREAAEQLAEELDQPVPDISCPDDLDAEVGATLDCELRVEGDDTVLPVHIEVTSVDDGDLDFTAEVGDAPIE